MFFSLVKDCSVRPVRILNYTLTILHGDSFNQLAFKEHAFNVKQFLASSRKDSCFPRSDSTFLVQARKAVSRLLFQAWSCRRRAPMKSD